MRLYQNRLVVKVGTSTLTNDIGQNNLRSFERLACVLADIQNLGNEVILVSSGAIAFDAQGDAIRDTAYIKAADTASGAWVLETVQTGSGS